MMRWLSRLLLLVGLSLPVGRAAAHGGGQLYVVNAPVEGYLVTVSTAPVPLAVQEPVHVTVSMADAVDRAPVLDGVVEVVLYDGDGRELHRAPATTEQSVNKLFYETDFPAVPAGDYRITVTVSGMNGGGMVEFWVEVNPVFPLNWLVGGLLGLLFLAFFFWYRTWQRKELPRRRTPRRPAPRRTTS
jgi:hypothetical protein